MKTKLKLLFRRHAPKWLLVLGLLPTRQSQAEPFVELTVQLEGDDWSYRFLADRSHEGGDERSIFTSNTNYLLRCVVGTNTWFFENRFGDSGQYYWFTGTNIAGWSVDRDDRTHSAAVIEGLTLHESTDGNPGRPVRVADLMGFQAVGRICWLAFCSGPCLKHEGRRIYPPLSFWKESRLVYSGWTDKTRVFKDDLGLPKSLDLLATNNQPVFQYQVHRSTNILGWHFPLEFYGVQYQPTATDLWRTEYTFKGRVTTIRPGNMPAIPAEVLNEIKKSAR